MREQRVDQLVAFAALELVDAFGLHLVDVQHIDAGCGMDEDDGMARSVGLRGHGLTMGRRVPSLRLEIERVGHREALHAISQPQRQRTVRRNRVDEVGRGS